MFSYNLEFLGVLINFKEDNKTNNLLFMVVKDHNIIDFGFFISPYRHTVVEWFGYYIVMTRVI